MYNTRDMVTSSTSKRW